MVAVSCTARAVVPDSITREIVIDAPPERVWAIVTEAQHLARLVQRRGRDRPAPGRGDAPDLARARHLPGARRDRRARPTPSRSAGCAARTTTRGTRRSSSHDPHPRKAPRTRLRVVESGFADLAWPEDERARYADENARAGCVELDELARLRRRAMSQEDADRLWAALGDPMRLRVLDLLLERGDATASALAAALPITRQGVAKHLAVLERAGLVDARRAGREVRFAVRGERLDRARRQMARSPPGGTTAWSRSSGSPRAPSPPARRRRR